MLGQARPCALYVGYGCEITEVGPQRGGFNCRSDVTIPGLGQDCPGGCKENGSVGEQGVCGQVSEEPVAGMQAAGACGWVWGQWQ